MKLEIGTFESASVRKEEEKGFRSVKNLMTRGDNKRSKDFDDCQLMLGSLKIVELRV